jgi:subtilase family serine protease
VSRVREAYERMPLRFEGNQGQTDASVKYVSRGSGYALFLLPTEAVLGLNPTPAKPVAAEPAGRLGIALPVEPKPPTVVRMKFVGGNENPEIRALDPLPGKSHYFVGSDRNQWRTDVPAFARVEYRDVYPGVSVVFYGNQRQLEYDFIVSPGADPGSIRLAFEGIDGVGLDGAGNLVLRTRDGEIVQKAPVVYQEINGVRAPVAGRYVLLGKEPGKAGSGEHRVGFQLASYDARRPLVIDPVLSYATYFGGSSTDVAYGIAVDADGNIYVTGYANSTNFPLKNALQSVSGGGSDAYVTKLSADGGSIIYSTFLGGNGAETGIGIAVDGGGNAHVVGYTNSTNFPLVNAYQSGNAGDFDVFVTKLNATGSSLVYSTYLGGSAADVGYGIAVDAAGSAYITGYTNSINFPVKNAYQSGSAGGSDVFVTKISPDGLTLGYSTYLGGNSADAGVGIALDGGGNAYVAGYTNSTNYPTKYPVQTANAGGSDAFVTKVNPTGSALVYSTYLGGTSTDAAYALAVDGTGNAYVTGYTNSTNFPVLSAFQTTSGGGSDVFVTKIGASGSSLVYSTYLGGSLADVAYGIAVDGAGSAYVTGYTNSTNYPTKYPVQTANAGGSDGFVTKLGPTGSTLVYSTYLGGSGADTGRGVALTKSADAWIAGTTNSTNLPLVGAFQSGNAGGYDVFLAMLSNFAFSVSKAGTGSGTVVSSPTGIDCGAACSASFADGTVVTLTAAPATGSSFTGWSGACTGTGTCSVTMDAAKSVTATFNVASGDLQVTALSNPPTTAVVGGSFSVTDTTANTGTAAAGASTTRYYLSTDAVITSSDKLLTGTRSVPSLAAGASSGGTVTVKIPAGTAAGTYYLGACADDTKVVTETSETNNCKASATTVAMTAPDLQVTSLSNPPATAVVGSGFSVTDTTANTGTAAAGASTTRYYLSTDAVITSSDKLLTGTRSVPSLAAGASSGGTVTVKIPAGTAAGTYYLGACADGLSAVAESNEANNCKASVAKVAVSLAPTISSLSPTSGAVGASVTINGANFGATQGISSVTFNGKPATPSSWSAAKIVAPVPTEATTGPVVVKVGGVSSNGVTFTVTMPDLQVTALSSPPVAAVVGESLSVTDTTANAGTASAGASTTRYYLSLDAAWSSGDALLTGSRSVPGLGAGATSAGTAAVAIPSGVATGTYYLLGCADDTKVVTESNETNNCKASTTTIAVSATPTAREKGLAWLIKNQKTDGSWGGTAGTEFSATAAASEALLGAGAKGVPYVRGVSWMGNGHAASADSLARQIAALQPANVDLTALVEQLLSWRNISLSWGAYKGFGTSFPDTALALGAIRKSGAAYSDADLTAGLCAILTAQKTGDVTIAGSWSYIKPGTTPPVSAIASAVIPTVYNVLEVSAVKAAKGWTSVLCGGTSYNLTTSINNGTNWLLTQRKNADGGFGESGTSTPFETALVYQLLRTLKPSDPAAPAARDFLVARQGPDGSWNGDALQTAVVVNALGGGTLVDTDDDGIPDIIEGILGTNPLVPDSRYLARGGTDSGWAVLAGRGVGAEAGPGDRRVALAPGTAGFHAAVEKIPLFLEGEGWSEGAGKRVRDSSCCPMLSIARSGIREKA